MNELDRHAKDMLTQLKQRTADILTTLDASKPYRCIKHHAMRRLWKACSSGGEMSKIDFRNFFRLFPEKLEYHNIVPTAAVQEINTFLYEGVRSC